MKRRTIKQEAIYFLRCQGHTATDQDIQRAIWRERKQRYGTVSGWSISSYLLFNKMTTRIPITLKEVEVESI